MNNTNITFKESFDRYLKDFFSTLDISMCIYLKGEGDRLEIFDIFCTNNWIETKCF